MIDLMLIRDLTWLVALADHGHVTDTAAILGITQPTLSRALARVEDELDSVLFERRPDGVRLTPDGELTIAAARDIRAIHDRLVGELDDRHDPDSGVVRLAFLNSMATSLVPRLLRDFHEAAPSVRVTLRQTDRATIYDELASGAVDLAVTSFQPEGHLAWLPIQTERLVVILPPSHRLAGRRRIRLAELEGDQLITTQPGLPYRDLCLRLLGEAGLSPSIAFETGDLATMEGLTAAGLGFAIVPEQYAGLTGSVGLAIPSKAAVRNIGLIWRKDRQLSPPAERMRSFIADHR